MWYKYGFSQRNNDQPALINSYGSQILCQNDQIHRDNDQPAIIERDGTQKWYQIGQKHRGGIKLP